MFMAGCAVAAAVSRSTARLAPPSSPEAVNRWRISSDDDRCFGFLGLAALFVPLANLLVAPALVVGATRLVLELRETEARA